MSRDILENAIEDFNPDKFTRFFREKNRNFAPRKEELNQYNDESFKDGLKLGEINFAAEEQMIICIFEVNQSLSERSGKKMQYEKGKRILREQQADSGIFIFCDKKGDFRFSLIYANYLGKRRDWSAFRRFTYFVSREFTNKTFLQRIGGGEFSTIENIKEAFSLEPVNKEFFSTVAMLFTKLAGGERQIGRKEFKGKGLLHLPSTSDDTLKKEFSIRLIGRLVFCWFLKKKHSETGVSLLPEGLLSSASIRETSNYYHSILEPLFFETLNTPVEERKKRFQSDPWAKVPFLNGGLFAPDDHDFYQVNALGTSMFINVLKVPDTWIKDLFEVFESYNFTIDENTSVDVEISIDPEMLGRIFENLLAEINPETGETARKSTGSYYTPRPIVEYMVDESLKQYLLNKTKVNEDKISQLLCYGDEEITLNESDKDAILGALDTIKIIDPACGSGAFPMGILHKMLLILQRIDPDSQKWIQKKLSQIESVTVRKELGKKLRKENWNYVHKLGIIQSSIYGVDIQPIATEISRLRFFLSLIVDEKVEDSEQNRGIDPLPNLEFKFVCANSLMSLAEEGGELFDNKEMAQQMQDIRDRYFKTDNARIKVKMKNDFEDVLKKGYSLFASQKQKQLLSYRPFDTNNVCSFFDSKFMFGVDGFDIVIGNPPYGFRDVLTPEEKVYFRTVEKIEFSSGDSAELFSKKCFDKLVKHNGILTFIIPKKSLYGDAWEGYRKDYWLKYCLKYLIDSSKAFENVLLEMNVFGLEKNSKNSLIKCGYLKKDNTIVEFATGSTLDVFLENFTAQIYKLTIPNSLWKKIQDKKAGECYVTGKLGLAIGTDFYSDKETDYKLLKGIDIARWQIRTNRWLRNKSKLNWDNAKEFLKPKVISQRLIAHIENPIPHIKITACYDEEGILITNTLMSFELHDKLLPKFWLAYLNSTFISWYAYNFIYARAIRSMDFYNFYIQQIPIPQSIINKSDNQKPLIEIVDKILTVSKSNDYLQNVSRQAKVKECERQIDQIVYKLYGLTSEEIKIVESFYEKEKK